MLGERLDATGYDTDKSEYLPFYEALFAPLRERPLRLLELGVLRGGSLELWRDYFPQAIVVGLDVAPVSLEDPSGRIHVFQGQQDDTALLDRIARELAPEGFDIVIDDAAHIARPARVSFWHLFTHHLRPGGIYALEDWGTGYWPSWPDGAAYAGDPADPSPQGGAACHAHGMVGLIKELVDEVAMGDITKPGLGIGAPRASRFHSLQLSHGLAIVTKRAG